MKGWRVLVTGAESSALCEAIESAGAEPIAAPTIAIRETSDTARFDALLQRANEYEWIVVTSANGVEAIFDRLRSLSLSVPTSPRWAVVGPRTSAALQARGVLVDCVPTVAQGSAIPDVMGDVSRRKVLLARARGADRELPRILRERGAVVDEALAYETDVGPPDLCPVLEDAVKARPDAIVFTSGSTVKGFMRLVGSPSARVPGCAVICIGPRTARIVEEVGVTPTRVAKTPTPEGIVEAILSIERVGA